MANMGVLFGDIHSFYDLNLLLSPFTPAPAKPKTNYVEVSGGNGSIDLTEAHGEVKYSDRDFSFTFNVHPLEEMSFDEKVTQVSNALNGKRCRITLDRDSGYYWEGRCSINSYKQDKNLKQIVISAKVKPYKLKQKETVYSTALSTTAKTIILLNDRKSAVPTIKCTNDNTKVIFGDLELNLSAGTHKILDICLTEGKNVLQVSGSGTITFTWQEGAL